VPVYDASGTFVGQGFFIGAIESAFDDTFDESFEGLVPAHGYLISNQGATFEGTSSASAVGGINHIATAHFQGSSNMEWDFIREASGTFSGTSSVSVTSYTIKTSSAVFQGTSEVVFSTFLVAMGTSYLSMTPQILSPATRAITMGPKTFRWKQLLQRGDISIYLCTGTGGNFDPIFVNYSMYYLRPDGSRLPIGAQHQEPVRGGVGEYYVAGRAGNGGQPGCWIVVWKYQRSTSHPLEVVEMEFQVLDAVLAQDPFDITERKVKFGWN